MKTSLPDCLFSLKSPFKPAILGTALLLSLSLLEPFAGATVITGNTADNELQAAGGGTPGADPTATAIRIGASAGAGRDAIFIFQLPDLGLVSNPFATANLSLTFINKTNSTAYNVDLWGLDGSTSSTTTIPVNSFFNGSSSDPNYFLIQDDFLVTVTNNTTYTTSGPNLAAFLNGEYAGGANIGKYVFIRANPDTTPTGTNGYNLATADSTTTAFQPVINYTAIPEPGSTLLLALGFSAVWVTRRRKGLIHMG